MEPLLRAENVTVCYNGKPVVEDVSFELQKGEILGVVGESGSGKSTVIKAVMGLLGRDGLVTSGDIYYKGNNVTDMPEKKRRKLRGPEMGMVFQDCKSALCPIRKVGVQIYECLAEHEKLTKAEAFRRAALLMKKIGLDDEERIMNSYPFELSGGMNQRIGICTAMLMNPSLLLADEPTSALDVTVQKRVMEELLQMRREYGTAMILVTHNIGLASAMADQILVMKSGKMMDYGPTDYVLHHSDNPYTRNLMNSVMHLNRVKVGEDDD